MRKRYPHVKPLFAALAMSGIVLMGCGGLARQPLAPPVTSQKVQEKTSPADSPFTLVLSRKTPDASRPGAARPIPRAVRMDVGWFSPQTSGTLQVGFPDYAAAGEVQVKTAKFTVAAGSLSRNAWITMTALSGATLEDVSVIFTPSGLTFTPSATLTLVLRGEIDPAHLKAYHIEGREVTEIPAQVSANGNGWTVALQVPGFSRYGMGDDAMPPEAGEGP